MVTALSTWLAGAGIVVTLVKVAHPSPQETDRAIERRWRWMTGINLDVLDG